MTGDKQTVLWHMRFPIHLRPLPAVPITTIAGFAALCFMTFKLGMDLGLSYGKRCYLRRDRMYRLFLPALILCFDKAIDKTTHKNLIPNLDGSSGKDCKGLAGCH